MVSGRIAPQLMQAGSGQNNNHDKFILMNLYQFSTVNPALRRCHVIGGLLV